jgi:DTW domain-containing protein YfiP
MHVPLCLCASWPRLSAATRVVLVAHAAEWRQSSNTGRVAVLTLRDAELAIWGRREQPLDVTLLARDEARTVILHPSGAAPLLGPSSDPRPVRLLVPDGTWRQSARIAKKLAALPGVERARIDVSKRGPSQSSLRTAPSHEQLGTGEAIAAALDALGDHEAAAGLRDAVLTMIDRALFVRGKLAPDRVRGGIPLEARREMSRSRGAPGS